MGAIKKTVTGIILAGGKSSRMGYDKGLAEVHGKRMIDWVIQALNPVCDHLMIISNTEVYNTIGLPVYPDAYKDIGPLGGIFTGLSHTTTDYNFVLACDMPLMTTTILRQILTYADGYEIIVPSLQGYFQPLCALYHKQIHSRLEALIMQRIWKMQEVIKHFSYKEIDVKQVGLDENAFANINNPAELQWIQKKLES